MPQTRFASRPGRGLSPLTARTSLSIVGASTPQPSWKDDSRCNEPDVDPEIFWPGVGESAEPARAYCRRCTVRSSTCWPITRG